MKKIIFFLIFFSAILLNFASCENYKENFLIPGFKDIPELNRPLNDANDSRIINYEVKISDIDVKEGNYSEIIANGFYITNEIGQPMLPIKYFEIELPPYAESLDIEVFNPVHGEFFVSKKIKPFIMTDIPSMPAENKIYKDYFSDPDLIKVDFGYKNGKKYALLKYYPFGYDSLNNKIRITLSSSLHINYFLEKPKINEDIIQHVPNTQWEKTFGGSGDDYANSIQKTDDGYIIAGKTDSFGPNYDVYVIKTDLEGNKIWEKTFGGDDWDSAQSVIQTDDGYVLAGYSFSFTNGEPDMYIVKVDLEGNKIWEAIFGMEDDDYANSIQKTDDGYIIAGSSFRPRFDIYLIKTDLDGKWQWEKTLGGSNDDYANSIQKTDNGYIIAGYTSSFGNGWQAYLVKVDLEGNKIWEKTFGGSKGDVANSVQTLNNGYILAGETRSFGINNNMYILRTDLDGNEKWEKTFGGNGGGGAYSVIQTDNGYIIAGYTSSLSDDDVYIIKLSKEIPADVNDDCEVNILDLIFIRNRINQDIYVSNNIKADVNHDRKINILDLLIVRNHLGENC